MWRKGFILINVMTTKMDDYNGCIKAEFLTDDSSIDKPTLTDKAIFKVIMVEASTSWHLLV